MPNDFNSEDFFQAELESNNGVLEKKFKAKNLTKGHEDDDLIDLRFVHFAQSNNEKRIPSLGDLFKANGVQENDVVRLESRIKDGSPSFYITFLRPDEAQINPKSFCFSVINDNTQDICEHSKNQEEKCLQQIFYGAPGTSKSYTINRITRDKEVIRTTFHPDSDYSTFVGAYKPTTDMLPICNELGEPMKIGGTSLHKEQIVYKFVAQSFLQAYINAWKMWLDGTPQYLVIEEINRGNCAQIFGDLFQLLDRNDAGYSDYPITADKDMQKQIGNAFGKINLSNEKIIEINSMYNGKSIAEKIFNGELLVLPNNLYIWATMNTSDQSLFPIDSAFKRRWDWTYMPISDAGKRWVIEVNNKHYDWWDFLTKINDKIASTTSSEDKKLGYFFCKADKNKIIKSDRFVGKVLFYLWNDVFKDYEFNNDIFNDESDSDVENKKLSFDKFYKVDGGNSIVVEDKVELFLRNLGVTLLTEENNNLPYGDAVVSSSNVEIKVNGQKVQYVNAVPYTAIEQYVKLNPNKTSEEILRIWDPFKQYSIRKWIVAGKEEREAHKDGEYSYEIFCADGNPIYVNKDGWMYHPRKGLRDTISEFIQAVNAANLGIKIEENSLQ
ncbi:GTPase [Bacteroides sp. D20]|nr:GTPase [Bacteroides sp. D20]